MICTYVRMQSSRCTRWLAHVHVMQTRGRQWCGSVHSQGSFSHATTASQLTKQAQAGGRQPMHTPPAACHPTAPFHLHTNHRSWYLVTASPSLHSLPSSLPWQPEASPACWSSEAAASTLMLQACVPGCLPACLVALPCLAAWRALPMPTLLPARLPDWLSGDIPDCKLPCCRYILPSFFLHFFIPSFFFLSFADTVICMEAYVPADVTAQAQAISRRHAGPGETLPRHTEYGDITPRCLLTGGWGLLAAGGLGVKTGPHLPARAPHSWGSASARPGHKPPLAHAQPAPSLPPPPPPTLTCARLHVTVFRVQCTPGLRRHTTGGGTCGSRPAPWPASNWTKMSWTSGGCCHAAVHAEHAVLMSAGCCCLCSLLPSRLASGQASPLHCVVPTPASVHAAACVHLMLLQRRGAAG
jgi:hypothetical protein